MNAVVSDLFGTVTSEGPRLYLPILTAVENQKGVLDVDTVKGCTLGMRAYPDGGCYGECYAQKTAARYGIDFSVSVSRKMTPWSRRAVFHAIKNFDASWYRIGTAGDPCHDWENTLEVIEAMQTTGKQAVIITKHWIPLTDAQILRLKAVGAVVNTSTSGLDTDAQTKHRIRQMNRLRAAGVESVNRVVTCDYGDTAWAKPRKAKQELLLTIGVVIDNPLRADKSNRRVADGSIKLTRVDDAVGGGKQVSLHNPHVYLGTCNQCPDQCGATQVKSTVARKSEEEQLGLLKESVEWVYVKSVTGSGYEAAVSKLAIQDVIAKRAARNNMQIHSAIILLFDGEFSGFFTFQNNDVSKEFCLLQSVIEPVHYTPELYAQMVREVIARNVHGYPALITTDPKSKFETPKMFESVGFQTYLKMSGFHYMVHGNVADVRMKLLAHITMTNVWNSVKGDWLRLKKEWRERIDNAGAAQGVANPAFASREGCWQGVQGMANVVTKDPTKKGHEEGRAHNGNASVLDPVACEVIARFFMPKGGKRIYNPFGGGVQMGYVAGGSGYEYVASEIRQNQCDANNKICAEFPSVKWVQSDSTTYDPDGMFDMVFSCPPYYKVERYVDYDGKPPPGEINSLDTYEKFRDVLFAGYKKAIEHLNDNCFFIVMTGDSRDKNGAYYCSESETELFFKENGLSVYNKIVYLECEFTRLAHAKKTLHVRKFPKREQKIIVAYKGKIKDIKDNYAPVGRL
ncbi:hypothetical protein UFOVP154_8 [uncultured Caudovirales phage]|uniref:AdoMet_MTases domain containing protein n=1 Tax=uncultured Caudovirales phage TaxID=2100421 RepID=A0A6J5KH00_9CAUD|nr:hypothetical protein UFOVP8_57 [uncultured Caudovirales phage]CAB5170193.1 hypothetical protein UFOVP154_8 [uncultured Caudovirales phage]